MSVIGSAGRASAAAFRTHLPAMLSKLRSLWGNVPSKVKTAAVAAAAAAVGANVGPDSTDLSPILAEAANRDITTNVDMVGAILSTLPEGIASEMLNVARGRGEDGVAVAIAAEAARARAFSTRATGDGTAVTDVQALAYDAVRARIALVRRAMAALGTTNPHDLRTLRDALFMDEQEFASALERC